MVGGTQKPLSSASEALKSVVNGATILVGGFGASGSPALLLEALRRRGLSDLTIISNNAGAGDTGLAGLIADGMVRKIICSFPGGEHATAVREAVAKGSLELELVPQGVLAERIRAGGAGIGGVLMQTRLDLEIGSPTREIEVDGRRFVLELPLRGEVALLRAARADVMGNLVYGDGQENFNTVMATAADLTIAEVAQVVPAGALAPAHVRTPGIFIDRLVETEEKGS